MGAVEELKIKTNKKDQVIDITDEVEKFVREFRQGMCHIFVSHTTACITTADLDPGTDIDILNGLRHLLPKGVLEFNHPHDPLHAPDHILSTIIGPSLIIPVKEGNLVLGIWQRIILIELDGPRERNVHLSFSALS
jgi:secondary thiamine-phosphate synthase enzyme